MKLNVKSAAPRIVIVTPRPAFTVMKINPATNMIGRITDSMSEESPMFERIPSKLNPVLFTKYVIRKDNDNDTTAAGAG